MPVDPADIPHLKLLMPKVEKANALIDDVIEDVASHAANSLTRTVVDADEGRETWRTLAGQRSAQAATKRLNKLQKKLAGETKVSLSGLIQDARAKFYREAFSHWTNLLPAAIVDPKIHPTASGERGARGLVWEGKSPLQELLPVFTNVRNGLQTAMNAAAVRSISDRQSTSILDGWEKKSASAIKHKVETMLSNSQIAILNLVGPDMIKGELKSEKK